MDGTIYGYKQPDASVTCRGTTQQVRSQSQSGEPFIELKYNLNTTLRGSLAQGRNYVIYRSQYNNT